MTKRYVRRLRKLGRRVGRWTQAFADVLRLVPARKRYVVIVGLTLASLLELIGLTMIIPLLATAAHAREGKGLAIVIESIFVRIGLPFDPYFLLGLIILGLTLKAIVGILTMRYVSHLVGNISRDFQIRLTQGILRARWSFFIGQPLGRLVQASGTEAAAVGECFEVVTAIIATCFTASLFLAVAAFLSWELLALILMITAMMFLSFGRLVQSGRAAAKRHRQHVRMHASQFTDAMIGFKQIRAMGRTDRFAHLFEKQARGLARSLRNRVMSGEYAAELQEPIIGAMIAFGFFFALVSMERSLSDVIIMALILVRTIALLSPVQRQFQRMMISYDLFRSLRDFLSQIEGAAERRGGTATPTFEDAISFEDVDFHYPGKPLLRHLDLELPAGRITAITGPSGIGKSTIVDLVVGLHQPTGGTVRVDGVDLEEVDLQAWRRQIGYVPQEITLFHDTIRNNITLWEDGIDEADVEAALQAAGAWTFVEERLDGLASVVGERGHRLSGGQRQRISIARALLHQPRLLILDEATTGLDPGTEAQICERVRALCDETGLTVLAVSHQPAWQQIADRVYVIQDGRAVPREADYPIAAVA